LALPPVSPPAAESRAPRAARAPEPPRQTRAAAPTPAPELPAPTEPQKNGREWTPAAAFTDREAASRLASSIQQQGYPVEIRQDRSSTRPWVVWIGAQPRGGDRRR
jgi:cell division septation protein DedD